MNEMKISLLLLLISLVCLSTISTDIYLASMPEMGTFFHTTHSMVQHTLTLYMAGFALSMLICGPLADSFGRKPIVICGIALHFISTLFVLFAPNIYLLIAARFFQALGGCCGTVLGRVITRDLFTEKDSIKILSCLSGGLALALMFAPIVGGVLQTYFGWRASFILLALLSGALFFSVLFLLKESLDPAKKQKLNFSRLIANYLRLLKNRHFLGYTSAITFNWSGYFSFVCISSFIFVDLLHLPPYSYGLLYGLLGVGYVCGTIAAKKLANRWEAKQSIVLGTKIVALATGLLLILVITLPLTSLSIFFPMFLFLIGTGLIMPNAQGAVTRPFPDIVGTASSLFFFIEMIVGAIAGAAISLFQNGTLAAFMTILSISSILLMATVYQLVWKEQVKIHS